jgi:hypothetical protein
MQGQNICTPSALKFFASAPSCGFLSREIAAGAVCKDQLALSALCYLLPVVTTSITKSKSTNRCRED